MQAVKKLQTNKNLQTNKKSLNFFYLFVGFYLFVVFLPPTLNLTIKCFMLIYQVLQEMGFIPFPGGRTQRSFSRALEEPILDYKEINFMSLVFASYFFQQFLEYKSYIYNMLNKIQVVNISSWFLF